MKIYLHEITDQDTDLDFTEQEPWVLEAVKRVDEPTDDARKPKPRTVAVHFNLRQVDEVVVVTGTINTHVVLVCSRCANQFNMECTPNFSALFCKDPVMAGIAHVDADEGKPMGQNKGFARHAHDTSKDLDITYLSKEYVDLGEVLTEQLQLQVPFQPLCKESCKGICMQCGADLNQGRCACAKLGDRKSPFSALKDLKV